MTLYIVAFFFKKKKKKEKKKDRKKKKHNYFINQRKVPQDFLTSWVTLFERHQEPEIEIRTTIGKGASLLMKSGFSGHHHHQEVVFWLHSHWY